MRKKPSEWKVSIVYAYVMEHPEYQVYRNRDKDSVDHEGNREHSGGVFDSQSAAAMYAKKLNEGEGDE